MIFQFPKKRIGDTGWFLSDQDKLCFGKVMMITIAIKESECNVWYSFLSDDETVLVNEKQVSEDKIIASPKYKIGDEVNYNFLTNKKQHGNTDGIISTVQVTLNNDEPVHYYFFEDDPEFWVTEDDIVGFSEPIVDVSSEMCTLPANISS